MSHHQVRKVLLAIEAPPHPNRYFHNLVPLGSLGLVSFLEKKGICADLVDMNVMDEFPDPSDYDAIGFSVTNANMATTLKRAESLRRDLPGLRLFAGGPGVALDPNYLLGGQRLDALIVGEAEPVIYKYLLSHNPHRIPGLYLPSKKGSVIYTGDQTSVPLLDDLPFPALNRVDFSLYGSPIHTARPTSSIVTSRGCPWRCTFCFHPHGYLWRGRSAHNVVDEIEWQVNKLGVREIVIYDDHFTCDQGRVSRICREITRRGIKVALKLAYLRVDCVSKTLLAEMKDAGVWNVGVAPESGNPSTLERTKKGFTLQRVKAVVGWCKELGIFTQAAFMIGFPWEGQEEVHRTIKFARELEAGFTSFCPLMPLPRTPLYEQFFPESRLYKNSGIFSSLQDCRSPKEKSLQQLVRRAYKSTTLRPGNILHLMRLLPMSSFVQTTRFARATRII